MNHQFYYKMKSQKCLFLEYVEIYQIKHFIEQILKLHYLNMFRQNKMKIKYITFKHNIIKI